MYQRKESPTRIVAPEFARWRTFRIGGVTPKKLLIDVRSTSSVDGMAERLMKSEAFTTQGREEKIETIILTPANLDYEYILTTEKLLDSELLARWSLRNAHRLPEGYAVDLLPAEAGPHIRYQYEYQPEREILRIAMKPMTLRSFSNLFAVRRGSDGVRVLGASWAGPATQWSLGVRFVYRLRKLA